MTRRRERRCKQILDGLKEKRGYGSFKEEALYGEVALEGCMNPLKDRLMNDKYYLNIYFETHGKHSQSLLYRL